MLSLFDVVDFRSEFNWVAQRLGITRLRAENVIQNLIQSGLLKLTPEGQWSKIYSRYRTTSDVPSAANRQSHIESLNLAKEKIEKIPLELREFTSVTVALDPTHLPDFKKMIREFNEKTIAHAKTGKQKEVYQVAIQFYPLTQLKKRKKNYEKK